ncbi:MAG: energy-coupling factor ABC transporter ATP-binding protein [Planctomycetota bacterium]|nr:energy-coupling factor ABC transporter ATP-binding protein [Planctomycetota bacterium]
MDEPVIQAENLSYAYPDGTRALEGVSFALAAGQKTALLGANGAGKSTLLMLLSGVLHEGFTGTLKILGLDAAGGKNLRQIRRRLGLVFQNPDDQLFCPTIREDVSFGPRNMKLSEADVSARVAAALAAVGLAGFERRSSFHLSLGEKKRAAIATVLAMQPELLALDEPTSMLDGRGRREVTALLKSLGGTQVIVTHDLDMIADLCDRVLVLSGGRLVADGVVEKILADKALLEAHGLI